MKRSPHKYKHRKHKEVVKAQFLDYQQDAKGIDPSYHGYVTSSKKAKINRGKADPQHKHHKTSPKDVTWETEPDSMHREGRHWVRVIGKQTKETARRIGKKMQRFRLF